MACNERRELLVMSKVLSAPVQESQEKKAPRDIYLDTSNRVRQGVAGHIWDNGSLDDKRKFAQDMFAMRIAGHELHKATGNAVAVPEIDEANGKLAFSMGKSSLSGYALQKDEGKALANEAPKRSRYEMATDVFGDIAKTAETENEFSGLGK